MKTYFYLSKTGDGWSNLAMDEYLLGAIAPGELILYLYVNENAVIIGKNQNPWMECSLSALEEDSVQLVRRISGGGAVYHDSGNLNFSFIAHKSRYDVKAQTELIAKALGRFGLECEVSGRNDLTAGGRKFSGSAYCSRGENSQHHGTLMINTDVGKMSRYLTVSPEKLKAKGVSSVRSRVCNLRELAPEITVEAMTAALKGELGEKFGSVEPYPVNAASELAKLREKHASWQWRMGAAPAFDYQSERRFDWGMAQLCLTVRDGLVSRAEIFTDSLDTTLPQRGEPLLTGVRFSPSAMGAALIAAGGDLADMGRWITRLEL